MLCYTSLLCSRGYQTPRNSRRSAAQRAQQVYLSEKEKHQFRIRHPIASVGNSVERICGTTTKKNGIPLEDI